MDSTSPPNNSAPADSSIPSSPAPSPNTSAPHAGGRPSGYTQETVGRLCFVIRRRGLSDAEAGRSIGVSGPTMSRWKHDHPELPDLLAMAREQYRDAKIGMIDEAKTADGRPDWRAAAWALEKAFPEDYGRASRTAAADLRRAEAAEPMPQPGYEEVSAEYREFNAALTERRAKEQAAK